MSSWKSAQSKRKNTKKVKLALIALGGLIGLLLLAQVFKFTQMFFTSGSSYKWDGDFNINLLIRSQSNSISMLSFSPKNEKIIAINLPNETYLEVAGELGMWQLGSLYDLGGSELLKKSLRSFFGLPIDGFLDYTSLEDLKNKNPFSIFSIFSKLKTDLTPFELIKLKMGLSSVRFDKIGYIDLESLGFLKKGKLADGTQIYTSEREVLDSLSENWADPAISSEGKTIAIFNSTDHSELAKEVARLISNTS